MRRWIYRHNDTRRRCKLIFLKWGICCPVLQVIPFFDMPITLNRLYSNRTSYREHKLYQEKQKVYIYMDLINQSKSCCSVFIHEETDLSEAFTELWAQLINEKENVSKNAVVQSNSSGL